MFGNLALIHATRSRDRALHAALRLPNPALWWITLSALAALAAAIYLPAVAGIFRFAAVPARHLAVAAFAGLSGVLWYEAYKLLRPRGRSARPAS